MLVLKKQQNKICCNINKEQSKSQHCIASSVYLFFRKTVWGFTRRCRFSKNVNFGRTLKSFYSLSAARGYIRKNNESFCRFKTRFS